MDVSVVVPTVGRSSLHRLLATLAAAGPPLPERVLLVHDARRGGLHAPVPPPLRERVGVVHSGGRGPAAARNAGWRQATTEWVAFLDDDVELPPGWTAALTADLAGQPAAVAGSQGRVVVPLPAGRAPTDWERNTAGLQSARWATADLAYRRTALVAAGGFDERFPRAYREDTDLGLRLTRAGWRIVTGRRTILHPPRPADRWVSVRLQAGNADDALLTALHGPGWREPAGAPPGRRPRHLLTSAAAAVAAGGLVGGRRGLATAALGAWLAGTVELAWARITPGPRTRDEVATMLATSAVLPLAATAHWLGGAARSLFQRRRPLLTAGPPDAQAARAVLFDRDGTLVVDEPYNGDPSRVRAVPGARDAVQRLRAAGLRVAVISNQSGVGRGLLSRAQVDAVNRRVAELLGPFDGWFVCPHAPEERCGCRKPAPGLVHAAAEAFGVTPAACVVVGDIGADVGAARAAGARAILVPTAHTRAEEVAGAPETATDLRAAVDRLLGARGGPAVTGAGP